MPKRVAVVVNKWWELDPLMFAITSKYLAPNLPWPRLNHHPRPRANPPTPQPPGSPAPRAVVKFDSVEIAVWCISDLLEHLPDQAKYQSSTQRKAERLPLVFGEPVDLCVAVGTASSGSNRSLNGCVVIGTRCFLHNSKPGGTNPDSNWTGGPFDTVIESTLSTADFALITALESPLSRQTTSAFLPPPNNPARTLAILADYNAVAVGNVNVTDYREYDATDEQSLAAFAAAAPGATLGSLETTHGVIRALGGTRFLFVSGIVDRLLHFNDDVNPAVYAQNTAGAHNAGVVVATALPILARVA